MFKLRSSAEIGNIDIYKLDAVVIVIQHRTEKGRHVLRTDHACDVRYHRRGALGHFALYVTNPKRSIYIRIKVQDLLFGIPDADFADKRRSDRGFQLLRSLGVVNTVAIGDSVPKNHPFKICKADLLSIAIKHSKRD